jgi:flagellin
MATTIDQSLPYINSYGTGNISSTPVDQISNSNSIEKTSNDNSTISAVDGLEIYDRAVSQSIEKLAGGIALANIAQDGIDIQKNILENIKEIFVVDQVTQEESSNKEKIEKLIQEYQSVVETTKFNNESLLKVDDESLDDLSIVTDEEIVSIYKADTTSVVDTIKSLLNNATSNPDARVTILDEIDKGIDQLNNFSNNFQEVSDQLETTIKKQLEQANEALKENKTVSDIDYAQEVTDFNKTNIMAVVGYFMQAQANAHTQRTVEILK